MPTAKGIAPNEQYTSQCGLFGLDRLDLQVPVCLNQFLIERGDKMSDGTVAGKSTKKFVVGIDLDGVVSDFVHDVRPLAAEWMGVPVNELTPHPDYEFTRWGHGMPGVYPEIHKFAVTQRGMFINSRPMEGAPQALRNLSKAGVYIRIITSRICIKWAHAEIVKQTVDWLEKHDIPYWDICFTKDKLAINADLYIDDSPHNIVKLRKFGRKVLTYKTSVNEGTDGPGADNWKDMERLILEEKEKYGESL